MKEKEPQNSEKSLGSELEALKRVRSLATPTLITLDFAIPVDTEKLKKMHLEPDGWKVFDLSGFNDFLKDFEAAFEEDPISFLARIKPRLGGSVYTTKTRILELNPKIVQGITYASGGIPNGDGSLSDFLVRNLGPKRRALLDDVMRNSSDRITVEETPVPGTFPIIFSFYHPGGRSMVLVKGNVEVKVSEESLAVLPLPTLLLVDARELLSESFKKAAVDIAKRSGTFSVVGLGADVVLPQAIPALKELLANAAGEVAFSGNRREVKTLLENWNKAKTLQEFMLETKLRFLLETNSQNGATLYVRKGDHVEATTITISPEYVSNKDTTNGGDDFLARVIVALMDGASPKEALEFAVKGTFYFLEERGLQSERERSTFSPLNKIPSA